MICIVLVITYKGRNKSIPFELMSYSLLALFRIQRNFIAMGCVCIRNNNGILYGFLDEVTMKEVYKEMYII